MLQQTHWHVFEDSRATLHTCNKNWPKLSRTTSTSFRSCLREATSAAGPIASRVVFLGPVVTFDEPSSEHRCRWCSSGQGSILSFISARLFFRTWAPSAILSWSVWSPLLSTSALPHYLSTSLRDSAAAPSWSGALLACWSASLLWPSSARPTEKTPTPFGLRSHSSVSTSSSSPPHGGLVPGSLSAKSSRFRSVLVEWLCRPRPTGSGTALSQSSPLIWSVKTKATSERRCSSFGVPCARRASSMPTSWSRRRRGSRLSKSTACWRKPHLEPPLSGSRAAPSRLTWVLRKTVRWRRRLCKTSSARAVLFRSGSSHVWDTFRTLLACV